MKRILLLILTSCDKFDDSKIWEELCDHSSRIGKLETLCEQMNTNISSMQSILTALQANDYVTSVTEVKQGRDVIGYTFAKSPSLKHLTTASACWYPAAGYLLNSSASLSNLGGFGIYWSCATNSNYAYYLYFNSFGVVGPLNNSTRAYGRPVRCFQE